ncbi:MAG: hypothetical protein M3P11_04875 [Actinomycetota bacterium]|nr:hypothetical protein [Actinomycetota bacterium]
MARESGAVFGPPERGKGSASRPSKGRLCLQAGCSTVLSTYNASLTCFAHTEPTYKHALYRG